MDLSSVFIFFAILNLYLVSSFCEAFRCPSLMQTALVPVFTPINEDGSLNLEIIRSEYAPYLSKAGVTSLEINAPITGSMGINIQMAMEIIQAWVEVKDKYGFQLICQVGGYTFPDVLKLAKFACKVGCDGLMVLPELYYKFNTTSLLVEMVSKVADVSPECAIGYNDRPDVTGVNLNMIKFFAEASKKIRRFAGIKTSYQTALYVGATNYLKPCQYLIIDGSFTLASTYGYGFNATSTPLLNVIPKQDLQLQNAARSKNLACSLQIDRQLNTITGTLLNLLNPESLNGYVYSYTTAIFKRAFVRITRIDVGPVVYPQQELTYALRADVDRLAPAYNLILVEKCVEPVMKTIVIKSYV